MALRLMSASDAARWSALTEDGDHGCVNWTGHKSTFGHGQFRHRGRVVGAHRLAWRAANGGAPIPDGLVVRHRCSLFGAPKDNPACVNPDHLELGTTADNNADQYASGTAPLGERHGASKLTDASVLEARSRYASEDVSIRSLAADYGVTDMVMRGVLLGTSWRHITGGVAVTPARVRRLSPDERETIIRRYRSGETQAQIAHELGRSVSAVVRTLHRAGLKRDRPGRPSRKVSP